MISYSFSEVGTAGITALAAATTAMIEKRADQAQQEALQLIHPPPRSTTGAVWTSASAVKNSRRRKPNAPATSDCGNTATAVLYVSTVSL